MRERAQIKVVGIEIVWTLAPCALDLGPPQVRLYRAADAGRNLVLEDKDVFEFTVKLVAPKVGTTFRIGELC